ncbi:CDP-glycerol glycerophosphotransferase family protein, partial [Staphylococcus epidermidis]|uniref:CDP-glycerol glycerophosphotransferase family protein n=1 Tax=Staphylococcus epidermidis TaxID=1282 RepID=UPI001642612F
KRYHITNELPLYLPTYTQAQLPQPTIHKENFQPHFPNYTLFTHFHPSTLHSQTSHSIHLTSLLIIAHIIITHYSSLPIQPTPLNKPTLIYNYHQQQYQKLTRFNQFYYPIPERYK